MKGFGLFSDRRLHALEILGRIERFVAEKGEIVLMVLKEREDRTTIVIGFQRFETGVFELDLLSHGIFYREIVNGSLQTQSIEKKLSLEHRAELIGLFRSERAKRTPSKGDEESSFDFP